MRSEAHPGDEEDQQNEAKGRDVHDRVLVNVFAGIAGVADAVGEAHFMSAGRAGIKPNCHMN
jgi:hypothetical protein